MIAMLLACLTLTFWTQAAVLAQRQTPWLLPLLFSTYHVGPLQACECMAHVHASSPFLTP